MSQVSPAAELLLTFDQGTLLATTAGAGGGADYAPELATLLTDAGFIVDPRAGDRMRAPAIAYRRALGALVKGGCAVDDDARAYETLNVRSRHQRKPYPHQAESLAEWKRLGRRGVVVLPTGAGKSYVAEMAIAMTQRSTLVVSPTIDLMNQWIALLSAAFGEELVGAIGGGSYDPKPLTATTYDSAYIHMARLGDRYGLIVFDECHHLPSASYGQAAECAIAPYRLGLTATPERSDGGEVHLSRLIGQEVYRKEITDLEGLYLSTYETIRVRVELSPDERAAYVENHGIYRAFVAANMIRMSRPDSWGRFIMLSSRSPDGRRAWRAWREQKRIPQQCQGKREALADILRVHASEQVIVFTADNDTVYRIAKDHLLPAITHQTPTAERQSILKAFNAGTLRGVVTSRVLNEGVDLPAASVGVVLSGSGSVREHVQRLGRILRKVEGKAATLYEVITADTGEERTSARRREHGAYRK